MGLRVRTQISKKNEHWLPKHRYLELMHFCLQYQEWKHRLETLDGYPVGRIFSETGAGSDGPTKKPVESVVLKRLELEERMALVEDAARAAADDLYIYLMRGVTEGIGYDRLGIPCCKDVYYGIYRRFFWMLDKTRK